MPGSVGQDLSQLPFTPECRLEQFPVVPPGCDQLQSQGESVAVEPHWKCDCGEAAVAEGRVECGVTGRVDSRSATGSRRTGDHPSGFQQSVHFARQGVLVFSGSDIVDSANGRSLPYQSGHPGPIFPGGLVKSIFVARRDFRDHYGPVVLHNRVKQSWKRAFEHIHASRRKSVNRLFKNRPAVRRGNPFESPLQDSESAERTPNGFEPRQDFAIVDSTQNAFQHPQVMDATSHRSRDIEAR